MSFSDLKRNSAKSLEKLTEELNKLNKTYENDDADYWYPAVDKAGNGYAVIRFLPAPEGEDMPFIRIWRHSFQGPTGQWYIEKSLTTFNEPDPVTEYNSKLWKSGLESDKEIARKQKRKLEYISNIYVIKDPANPENEGKVFKFKFGKKIFDKLNYAMNPTFPDEAPVNPFDLWTGANFVLKIRTVDEYRNYDKSEFEKTSALFDDDDKMKDVYDREFSLKELLDRKHFKSYDQLSTRFNMVLGLDLKENVKKSELVFDTDENISEAKEMKTKEAKVQKSTDDDDDLAFFRELAEED